MTYISKFRIDLAVAFVAAATLFIAPFAFAQSVNFYNSPNPNPTGNPSVTNTIIPGAINIPTGNASVIGTPTVVGVPAVIGVSAGNGNSSSPDVPNTGGVMAPGVPNTGAGGESTATLAIMATSILLALIGGAWLAIREKRSA